MKFCERCGKEMFDEAVLCVSCGHQVKKINSNQSNTLPIVALVFSFLLALVGVVLGIYGAYKCKGVNSTGYKISIAAIIVGVLNGVLGFLINFIFSGLFTY